MTWLKKEKGGTSVGPYAWDKDGDVTEVPDALAADLLAIPDGGYSRAEEPKKPAPKAEAKAEAPAAK